MELPVRKTLRLADYDYGQNGYYFITVCTKNREELLCRPPLRRGAPCAPDSPDQFQLSDIGFIVDTAIRRIPNCYSSVSVEQYVIMPNHIHMIVVLCDDRGRTRCAPTISRIIKQTKQYVTKQIGFSIWQKSFHDHIIRDEQDFQRIWNYIAANPIKWEEDCYYRG